MLREALGSISYRGCLICFAGSTVILDAGNSVAEFDGIAFLLSREIDDVTMLVVEAKNTTGGHLQAERQIRDQFQRLQIADTAYDVQYLGRKGAYARLKLPAAKLSAGGASGV